MTSNKSKWESIQQKINIIIYGTNTPAGRLFDLILLGVILLSVILVMLETVEGFDVEYHREILILEWIIQENEENLAKVIELGFSPDLVFDGGG